MSSDAKIRLDEADKLSAEAEGLKRDARLEDLHLWQMEKIKTSKKGSRKYAYWMAAWREGGRTCNVHLGSSRKMDAQTALQKARRLKAETLGRKER
jgi:regulator of replication initiation timing